MQSCINPPVLPLHEIFGLVVGELLRRAQMVELVDRDFVGCEVLHLDVIVLWLWLALSLR